jgi:periplasmic copper chaperone A
MQSRVPRSVLLAAAAIVGALVSATPAAQDKGVKASNARVKLPEAGETDAIAFVTIENPGMYDVNVISAKADVAGKVELRDAAQGGEASRKAITFITVPAYGRVDMASAGVHLVLLSLKRPIKEGDNVTLTLSTDVDITLTVVAQVRKE